MIYNINPLAIVQARGFGVVQIPILRLVWVYSGYYKMRILAAPDIPNFDPACIAQLAEVGQRRHHCAGSNFGRRLCQTFSFYSSLSIYFLLLLLTSCGYRFGSGEEKQVAIPYVEGDDFGLLTNALVRRVNAQESLSYTNSSCNYVLKVCLNPPKDENVGFWYAPSKSDKGFSNIVVPMEARVTLTAKVELYDCRNNCRVFGPCKVSSFLDYDFNSDLTDINEHEFSLGQLEMHNIAMSIAIRSLYDELAEKIVDYVAYSW